MRNKVSNYIYIYIYTLKTIRIKNLIIFYIYMHELLFELFHDRH